jgi:prolyl-tRNA synthetase
MAREEIRNYFDKKIKTIGVRNCYYPLFITRDNLEKEQSHGSFPGRYWTSIDPSSRRILG